MLTAISSWMGLGPQKSEAVPENRVLVYRMRSWPEIRSEHRSAALLQTLTRMSIGPVTHAWFVRQVKLPRPEAEMLLNELMEHEYVECRDLSCEAGQHLGPHTHGA